jgi:hypothetical protein
VNLIQAHLREADQTAAAPEAETGWGVTIPIREAAPLTSARATSVSGAAVRPQLEDRWSVHTVVTLDGRSDGEVWSARSEAGRSSPSDTYQHCSRVGSRLVRLTKTLTDTQPRAGSDGCRPTCR